MEFKAGVGFLRRWLVLNKRMLSHHLRQRKAYQAKSQEFFSQLPEAVYELADCCFVLSTGRCGTELLTRLLEESDRADVYHTPKPELKIPSQLAYLHDKENTEIFEFATIASRLELILDSFITDRIYVETNNRITFFAPFLANIFQRSRFVHLTRHPGDFVTSAMRRRYFSDARIALGLIRPRAEPYLSRWESMNPLEKNAWLWNETNTYIEEFKGQIDPGRFIWHKSEEMFNDPEAINRILSFMQLEPMPSRHLGKMLAKPVNKQKEQGFPQYTDWTSEQRRQLKEHAPLAVQYEYEL